MRKPFIDERMNCYILDENNLQMVQNIADGTYPRELIGADEAEAEWGTIDANGIPELARPQF